MMPEKKHDYSAKDFREPLLIVLGNLADFVPFRAVRLTETYAPVCNILGIAADQFGELEGKPAVHQWIQWAFRDLKTQGYGSAIDGAGINLRRGWWALTQEGADKARGLLGVPSREEKNKGPLEDSPEKGEEDIIEDDFEGYHPDPYIRALAVDQTPCFGHFDSTQKVCNKCLLQAECGVHLKTELAAFCRRAEKQWRTSNYQPPKVPDQKPVPDPKDTELGKEEGAEGDSSPSSPIHRRPKATGKAVVTKTLAESVCFVCGAVIAEGEDSMWVREHKGDQGICCIGCYESEVSV